MLYFWEHVGKRNQRTGKNHCQRKQYGGGSGQRFIGSFRHTGDDCIDGKDGKTELVDIDRRRLVFHVECYDTAGLIGEGDHERFIIDEAKFMAKTDGKLQ